MQVCAAAPECPPRTRAPRVLQGAGYSRYPRAMPPSGGARHALAACAHQVNAYEHMERRSRRHRMHRRACMRAPAPPRRLVVFQLRKRQRRHLWRHRQWRSISCQWPERRRRRTSATFAAGEAAHVVPLVTIDAVAVPPALGAGASMSAAFSSADAAAPVPALADNSHLPTAASLPLVNAPPTPQPAAVADAAAELAVCSADATATSAGGGGSALQPTRRASSRDTRPRVHDDGPPLRSRATGKRRKIAAYLHAAAEEGCSEAEVQLIHVSAVT